MSVLAGAERPPPRTGADVAAGAPPRHAALGRSVDGVQLMRLVERYSPLRGVLTLRQFRLVLAVARAAALPGALVAGLLLGLALRLATRQLELDDGPIAVAAVAGLVCYAELLCLVRTLGWQRRRQVADPPQSPLLRALDIGRAAVFVEVVARPLLRWQGCLAAAILGALTALGPAPGRSVAWALLLVPLGAGTAAASVAAARCRDLAPPRWWRPYAVATAVGLSGGVGVGMIWRGVASDAWASIPTRAVSTIVLGGSLLVAVIGLASAPLGLRAWRRLRPTGYPPASRDPRSSEVAGATVTTPSAEAERARRAFQAGSLAHLAGAGWRSVLVAVLFGVGVVVTGAPIDRSTIGWSVPLVTGYAYVTALVTTGLAFAVAGPTAMLDRYRWHWENGTRSAAAIAWSGLRFPLGLVAVPAALVSLGLSWVAGRPDPTVVALAVTLVGAAAAVESLTSPVRQPDGTTTASPVAAVLILLATAPHFALPATWWGGAVHLLYTLTVLGAGHACLRIRIQHHR